MIGIGVAVLILSQNLSDYTAVLFGISGLALTAAIIACCVLEASYPYDTRVC